MVYTFALLTLVTFSTLAMDPRTISQPDQTSSTKKPTTKTVAISQAGGIQSLVSATKDDQEVLLIGHARVSTWDLGPFSLADDEAKQLILSQMEFWSQEASPIVYISLDSQQTCKDHAQKLEHHSTAQPHSHKPLQGIINGIAASRDFAYGSLQFICMPEHACYEATNWDPTAIFGHELFPDLAEHTQLATQQGTDNAINDLSIIEESFIDIPLAHQTFFLSRKGKFGLFIKTAEEKIRSYSQTISVQDYYNQLASIIHLTKELIKRAQHTFLKKYAETVLKRLNQTPNNVASYLASYGIKKQDTLLEALYTIIRAERRINDVCIDFRQELISPLKNYQLLVLLETILDQATTHKRVILALPYTEVAEASSFLESSGYKVTAEGNMPYVQTCILGRPPFTRSQIHTFLTERFALNAPTEELEEASPFKGHIVNAFGKKTLGEELLHLALDVQPSKRTTTTHPPANVTCKSCKLETTRDKAYVYAKKSKTALCSSQCLTDSIISQKASNLYKLLTQQKHSPEEKLALEHIAALCYLKHVTLCPSIALDEGTLFELKLQPVEALLKIISAIGQRDPSWQKALSLVKPLHIEPKQLLEFFEQYHHLKSTYLKECLAHLKKKNRHNQPPTFDPQGLLSESLTQESAKLMTSFSLPHSPNTHITRIYYTLLQKLPQVNPSKLINYLKTNIPGKNMNKLLKQLN